MEFPEGICPHYYGFNEAWIREASNEEQEYMDAHLVEYDGQEMDITFDYCPMCGERLTEKS